LEELLGRVAGRFGRVEPRRHARAFVLGLLADLPRKNCWTIAEHAGHPSPDGMQHLLARAVWDQDAVRDDLRAAGPSASPTRSGLRPSRPWLLGCSAALWMPRSRQRG
jgi:SRSO17 transposase